MVKISFSRLLNVVLAVVLLASGVFGYVNQLVER
jgi:hypothetical protein